ncbi:MAG: type II secretion system F family protein [Lachnospiraceae bacterium]|nr:type II secretion system F family protein [Lachnospiraceae bacterium]
MADFSYEAITANGKEVKGTIVAENPDSAKAQLKNQGLTVTNVKEQGILDKEITFGMKKKITPRELAVFCRQFVSMSKAGVTIIECLSLLREQTENPRLAQAIRDVQTSVEKGETLAYGLESQPDVFPSLMCTTIAAGEASGSLEVSLDRMADQFEKSAKTQALVKKAMIYPIVVACVALAVVVLMLVKVIPSYTDMFDDLGTELPKITQMVVAASDFIIAYWFILAPVIIAVVMGLKTWFKTDSGKLAWSTFQLKVPAIKNLVVKSACSSLARTLSTLLAAGVGLTDAVGIVADTMTNVLIKDALRFSRDEVMKGVPLSEPIEDSGLFPPMLYHMMRIGEEAGNSEEMLTKLADYYDEEVEMATQSLMALMEPAIILVLAGVVGVLIGAIMAPMLAMYQAMDSL